MKALSHSVSRFLSKWPCPIAAAVWIAWYSTLNYPDKVHWYTVIPAAILGSYLWEMLWGILAKLTEPEATEAGGP